MNHQSLLMKYNELSNIKLPDEETSYPYCIMNDGEIIETAKRITLEYQHLKDAYIDKSKWDNRKSSRNFKRQYDNRNKRYRKMGGAEKNEPKVLIIIHQW